MHPAAPGLQALAVTGAWCAVDGCAAAPAARVTDPPTGSPRSLHPADPRGPTPCV